MDEKVETWVVGVKRLSGFVRGFPHAAYTSLMMSLQKDWQFIQSITPGVDNCFPALYVVGGRR